MNIDRYSCVVSLEMDNVSTAVALGSYDAQLSFAVEENSTSAVVTLTAQLLLRLNMSTSLLDAWGIVPFFAVLGFNIEPIPDGIAVNMSLWR